MPRRSSGGGYRSRPAPRAAPRPAPARTPPPQTVNHAPPPPATAQPQRSGGFGSMIADGMAWGTGNAVAHRVMDAVMGPRTIKHETVVSEAPPASASPVANGMGSASASPVANSMGSASCDTQSKAFMECVNNYGNDISKCQFYMDMLSECKKNSGSMMAA
ncbi:hypothetical protein HA466_0000980 [Hirschfeldia incana]|nr:hypothetical protein HA466_0000980 [Hirschfeldia incana]